jgi:hypothetical protein
MHSLSVVQVVHGAGPPELPLVLLLLLLLPLELPLERMPLVLPGPASQSAPVVPGEPVALASEELVIAPGDSPASAPEGAGVPMLPPQPMSAGLPSDRRSTTARRMASETNGRRIGRMPVQRAYRRSW